MSLSLALFPPESKWKPALYFPNIPENAEVGIDLETNDPNLIDKGPGSIRKDGYPVGIALAVDGFKSYYPFRHLGGGNLEESGVIQYFKDLLQRPDLTVIGANLQYDVEWLNFLGIQVLGKHVDIQITEGLINEEAPGGFSLNAIAKRRFNLTKKEELLIEAAAAYGVDPKSELWKLPSWYVGEYAETDAELALKIHQNQKKDVSIQELGEVYEMECRLIPIVLKMRQHGIRVNMSKVNNLCKLWEIQEEKMMVEVSKKAGFRLDPWRATSIGRYCSAKGIQYGETPTGDPSFTKASLNASEDPVLSLIGKIRSINRHRETYLKKLFVEFSVKGRIHPTFNQSRSEDGGARSGRFSCKNPNIQQVPSRSGEYAAEIRSCLLPDEGEKFGKYDYSQQEPRLLVHYSASLNLQGAAEAADQYIKNPNTDYYQLVADEASLKRKPAKDLTLGICYGEGMKKIAADLGVDIDTAKRILQVVNDTSPYISEISRITQNKAKERGYIKTLSGRRRHFNLYEPTVMRRDRPKPLPFEEATRTWTGARLQRAYTYKALNALIQGSAADMTKLAILKVWDEEHKIPLMQVHDELDYSVATEIQANRIKSHMENAVKLKVPVICELEYGEHWK